MGRKLVSRNAEDWKQIVVRWGQSRQSQRVFCQEQGIALSSFIRWRARLSAEAPPPFVAVGGLALAGHSTAPVAAIVRLATGAELRLSELPPATWLREVLGS